MKVLIIEDGDVSRLLLSATISKMLVGENHRSRKWSGRLVQDLRRFP